MTLFEKTYHNAISFKENMRDSQLLILILKGMQEKQAEAEYLFKSGNVIQSVLVQQEAVLSAEKAFEKYTSSVSKYVGKIDFIGIA